MDKRNVIKALAALPLALAAGQAAAQARPFKIGFLAPMTGPFASTGKQMEAAARLFMKLNGSTVAGRKVELILKDDTGVPDMTKRLAQELVVNDKVDVLAGFGLTPLALSTAPIASQSKTPMVIMAAATSIITEASPYFIRTSFTLPQTGWSLRLAVDNVTNQRVPVAGYDGSGAFGFVEAYFNDPRRWSATIAYRF